MFDLHQPDFTEESLKKIKDFLKQYKEIGDKYEAERLKNPNVTPPVSPYFQLLEILENAIRLGSPIAAQKYGYTNALMFNKSYEKEILKNAIIGLSLAFFWSDHPSCAVDDETRAKQIGINIRECCFNDFQMLMEKYDDIGESKKKYGDVIAKLHPKCQALFYYFLGLHKANKGNYKEALENLNLSYNMLNEGKGIIMLARLEWLNFSIEIAFLCAAKIIPLKSRNELLGKLRGPLIERCREELKAIYKNIGDATLSDNAKELLAESFLEHTLNPGFQQPELSLIIKFLNEDALRQMQGDKKAIALACQNLIFDPKKALPNENALKGIGYALKKLTLTFIVDDAKQSSGVARHRMNLRPLEERAKGALVISDFTTLKGRQLLCNIVVTALIKVSNNKSYEAYRMKIVSEEVNVNIIDKELTRRLFYTLIGEDQKRLARAYFVNTPLFGETASIVTREAGPADLPSYAAPVSGARC